MHLLHISLGNLVGLFAEYREPGAQHQVANEATYSAAHVYYGCSGRVLETQTLKPPITLDPSHPNRGNNARDHET